MKHREFLEQALVSRRDTLRSGNCWCFLTWILTTAVSSSVVILSCRSRKWWPQIWAPLVGVGLRRCHVKCAEASLDEAALAMEPQFGQSLRELLKHSKMLKQQTSQVVIFPPSFVQALILTYNMLLAYTPVYHVHYMRNVSDGFETLFSCQCIAQGERQTVTVRVVRYNVNVMRQRVSKGFV